MNMFSMIGADKIQFDNDIAITDYGGGYTIMICGNWSGQPISSQTRKFET